MWGSHHGEWWWWVVPLALSVTAAWAVVRAAGSIQVDLARPAPFLLVIASASVMMLRERRRGVRLSPVMMALAAYLAIFGLVPLADLALGDPTTHNPAWQLGGWLAWVGLLCMYVGYLVGLRFRRSRPPKAGTLVWWPQVATLLAVLFLVAAIVPVLPGLRGAGGLSGFASSFGFQRNPLGVDVATLLAVSLGSTALLLRAGNWLSRPTARRGLPLFFVWLPVVVFLSASHGARWRAFALFFALLGIYHLGIKRLRWHTFALLAVTLAVVFIVAGGFRHGRVVRNVLDPAFQRSYVSSQEVGQFRAFVITLDGVPSQLPFQRGKTLLSLIPGAPFPTAGALFTSTFYPELWAGRANVPTPLPGELYLNFGIPGIVGGMVVFGAALGFLESYRRRHQGSRGFLLIYAYSLLPAVGIIRGDLTTFLGYYLVVVLPLVLVLPFVERTHRSAPTVIEPVGRRSRTAGPPRYRRPLPPPAATRQP